MIKLTVTFFVLALIAGVLSLTSDIEQNAAMMMQYIALACIGLFLISLLAVQARNRHH